MRENEIKYLHFRKVEGDHYSSKGGVTVAYVIENNTLYFGEAICSSEDLYNKEIGRKIAESRIKYATQHSNFTCNELPKIIKAIKEDIIELFTIKMHYFCNGDHIKWAIECLYFLGTWELSGRHKKKTRFKFDLKTKEVKSYYSNLGRCIKCLRKR